MLDLKTMHQLGLVVNHQVNQESSFASFQIEASEKGFCRREINRFFKKEKLI